MKHHEKCIHYNSIVSADRTECLYDCYKPLSLSESLIRLTKVELINLIIEIQLKAQDEILTRHKLGDNWGMTFEQSKKVNELATYIHNTAYQEIIKTIKNYIKNIYENEV